MPGFSFARIPAAAAEGDLTMSGGGIGLEDILLFTVAAGVLIVLGGGAFQAWRSWSDDRRIRKHLGK